MLRAHVENAELGLESSDAHLVHLDVFAIELNVRHAVADVRLVAHRTGAEIEEFHVSVVVARCDASLLVVEGVPECHRPAVPDRLSFTRLQGEHGIFHARIPQAYTAIASTRDCKYIR